MIAKTISTSAADTSFLDAVKGRRSYYSISDESPIPDSRIQELVEFTIKHAPSAYNVQSARAVVLFGDEHRKLWTDIVPKHLKPVFPAEKWAHFEPRLQGFANGHGTVMFFEDQTALEPIFKMNPTAKTSVPEWSANSQGLHHFILWTALEAEGLGASLQHVSSFPAIAQEMKNTWNLPESWTAHAQLVFGKPLSEPAERSYQPVEDRVRVFA